MEKKYPWGPPQWTYVENRRTRLLEAEERQSQARAALRIAESESKEAGQNVHECTAALAASESAWNSYLQCEYGNSQEETA